MKFSNQGILSTSGTAIHTAPDNNMSEVTFMRFCNASVSCNVTVQKGSTIIYSVDLAAGDVLTDDDLYVLEENELMTATSSVAGTSYVVSGEDMPNIKVVRCK
jgi:hypothetical protein